MKKNFITGLAILLPFALTFGILIFCIKFLTNPFLWMIESILAPHQLVGHQFLVFLSRIAILLLLLVLTIFVGFLARWIFLDYVFQLVHFLMQRIPLVNKIYAGAKEITTTFLNSDLPPFSKVVLVPFPHPKCYALGFVMRDSEAVHEKVSILIAGCPNPLMGFMQIYSPSEVVELNIPSEEAVKFIISCGLICPTNLEKKETP